MKRILFVDDDPYTLMAMERNLRPMRHAWEMSFVQNGKEALDRLQQAPHEAIVTDLMMPGMNGCDLLEAARESSPQTVRLVLSGQVDHKLSARCVGLAHQYLAKPCDAESLKRTITFVTEIGFLVRTEKLLALVTQLRGLPSLPAVYLEVLKLLDNPNASPADIGALISKDVSLTAHILKTVNSAFFGLPQRVLHPAEAVAFLGVNTLRAILVATSVFDQLSVKTELSHVAAAAIAHGRKVAAAARAIAMAEKSPRAFADECFTAGLLHDIGRLVLSTCLPENFPHAQPPPQSLTAECEVYGATHADVGGYLLGLWGLPDAAVEAACLHHMPAESPVREFLPLTAVHVADCLVARTGDEGAAPSAPLDEKYLADLGLSARVPLWRTAVDELTAGKPANAFAP